MRDIKLIGLTYNGSREKAARRLCRMVETFIAERAAYASWVSPIRRVDIPKNTAMTDAKCVAYITLEEPYKHQRYVDELNGKFWSGPHRLAFEMCSHEAQCQKEDGCAYLKARDGPPDAPKEYATCYTPQPYQHAAQASSSMPQDIRRLQSYTQAPQQQQQAQQSSALTDVQAKLAKALKELGDVKALMRSTAFRADDQIALLQNAVKENKSDV